jgi:hypothetical protein
MAIPSPTTTSRRSPPFTWCSTYVVVCRSSSRPSLARRPVFSQLAASPTSFPLEEPVSTSHEKSPPRTGSLRLAQQVSASHEKSSPRTTSLAPTSAWAGTHGANIATDAYRRANLHVTREQQLAAMRAACPIISLNAGLIGCVAITSPSYPTLPHASSGRGTQAPSTTCKLSKYSGRLRQAQTTRREGQASRSK